MRKFERKAVPHGVIEKILKLALTAPSSKSVRSTRFMVVDEPELMEKISLMRDFGAGFVKDAPCGVLVMGDAEATDLWVDNASISAMLLQLAAEDAGLGSCWVHVNARLRDREQPSGETAANYLRSFLPIPDEWRPLCFVAMGYPAELPKPRKEYDDDDKVIWL